ncbi:MAG: hypothetical protein CVV34_01625 [Methanomicrobiales archaeon HGW-Methanomicrobiales-5]|nr:MAG: hypothetical protein CVV34_01625 [Methanomicrobiales archaeon HGW-Methanomicrobiales-5]
MILFMGKFPEKNEYSGRAFYPTDKKNPARQMHAATTTIRNHQFSHTGRAYMKSYEREHGSSSLFNHPNKENVMKTFQISHQQLPGGKIL